MKEIQIESPGYKQYEYLLVINPHEELRNKISQIRKQFAEVFRCDAALHARPHLPLVKFVQYQMMEERLVNRLHHIAMGARPFKVELSNYGSIPTHSIYIDVISRAPIQSLVKQIRTDAQRLMKINKELSPQFMMEPHFIIARRLQPWQFEKGWLEYSHKQFTGRFIADAMLLLKRPVGKFKYEIAHRFEFQNLPVTTTQGMLFV